MSDAISEVRRAALERLGLRAGMRDFNLERIVRVAAHALNANHAAFSIRQGSHQVYVANYHYDIDSLDAVDSLCHSVSTLGDEILLDDIQSDPIWIDHPALRTNPDIRAYAGAAVQSPDGQLVGTLSVWHPEPRPFNRPATRRVLFDSVRLVEDTLIMRSLMVRDPLTELFNRRYFEDQITLEWQRAMRLQLPISMAILNVDHFAAFAAATDQVTADDALIRIANILKNNIRRAGDCICRSRGDEFAMILPMTDGDAAIRILDEIRDAVTTCGINNPGVAGEPPLTVSAGVATAYSQANLQQYLPGDYLAMADDALRTVKLGNRNRALKFDPGMASINAQQTRA